MKKKLAIILPASLILATIVFYAIGTRENNIDLESLLYPSLYPPEAIVCRDIVDSGCVAKVAQNVGHPVAWLSAEQGLRHITFAALRSSAIQDLRGEDVAISIESPPQGPPNGRVLQTVRENGIEAEVRTQALAGDAREYEVNWTFGGQDYRIGAIAIDSEALEVGEFLSIWRRIQYGSP